MSVANITRDTIRNMLASRVDVEDRNQSWWTFTDTVEQSPNLEDHLNDLINAADKEKTLAIATRIQESLQRGVENVTDDVMDTYE